MTTVYENVTTVLGSVPIQDARTCLSRGGMEAHFTGIACIAVWLCVYLLGKESYVRVCTSA